MHDRIFIFWLLYLGSITGIYAFSIEFDFNSPLFLSGMIASFLLQGPFLYGYVSTLTLNHHQFKTRNIGHFAPFLAFLLYLFIATSFHSYIDSIRLYFMADGTVKPPLLFLFFLMITALSGPVYFALAQKKVYKIKESNLNFSSKEIDLDWLGKLIPAFGFIWIAFVTIAILHHSLQLFSVDFYMNGFMLLFSICIILIGYFGLKQIGVFNSYLNEESKSLIIETENSISKLKDEDLEQCFCKIDDYFKNERPYLEPDLTLPKLAKNLKVPHHHLSQVINEVYGQNFFDFINKYRVEEVKNKIVDPKFNKYTLLGIAYESGFNSKSAFNRVFKKFTNKTPSEFRDSK